MFYGATRYGMVVYPYLFLLAADPLAWVARRLRAALETGGFEVFQEKP